MRSTLFISVLSVLVVGDMSRIADILNAESVDWNCNLNYKTNSQSLGHKIAQVVCDEQTSLMNKRFISFVKYSLFGIICSISTYLVFANDSKSVKYAQTEIVEIDEASSPTPRGPVVEKQESECVEPEKKEEICLQAVELQQVNLMPERKEIIPATETFETISSSPKESEKEEEEESEEKKHSERNLQDVNEEAAEIQGNLSECLPTYPPVLNLGNEELVDFEAYKNSIDRQHTQFYRPRSFSDPKGCERYVQYPFTIEDAIQQNRIGEPPLTMPLNVIPTFDQCATMEDDYQPGSPNLIEELAMVEPGSLKQIPPEQKINERKPMVFVGGVSASTTPLELVTELKKQGFNVTVVPRIRYGVSFGFCPDLVLSSQEEVEKLLGMGRVWVKDRWVDIRPYIPKEEPQMQNSGKGASDCTPPSRTPPEMQMPTQQIHDVVENNVEYISHEDILSSCPTSPAPSQNATPPIGNSSPVTPGAHHHFMQPHMNPPFIQMTPVIPFSPGNYPQMVHPHFFPPASEPHYVFSPHHTMGSGMHSPSPPEKHPMQMFDEHLSPNFQFYPEHSDMSLNLQHPVCHGGVNNVFKLVSN